MKIQLIVDIKTNKIICIAIAKGSTHDFQLFKDSVVDINKLIKFLADSGYQGIHEYFPNSQIPKKNSKLHKLTKADKEINRIISRNRIAIEHVNAVLKVFRILSSKYRNRRRRFALRVALICGIYNYELTSS